MPRRNTKNNRKRHTNKHARTSRQRGKTEKFCRRMARELGVPYGYWNKEENDER